MNVDLLKRTLAHIEEHPEEWDQGVWRCGTGMCFAGWAATFAGGEWAAEPGDVYDDFLIAADGEGAARPPGFYFATTVSPDTLMVSARRRATSDLGLTDEQADALFDPNNTLDDLRRIVAELCGGSEAQS